MTIFAQNTARSELELLSPNIQIKDEIAKKTTEIMEHREVLEEFEESYNMPKNRTVKFLDVVGAIKPIIKSNEQCLRLISEVKDAVKSHVQSKQNLEKIFSMITHTKKQLKNFRKLMVESAVDPASDKGLQSALTALDLFIKKDHRKPSNKNVFLGELEAVESSLLSRKEAYDILYTNFLRASEREQRIKDLNLERQNLRVKLQPSIAGSHQTFLNAPKPSHKRKASLDYVASVCNLL